MLFIFKLECISIFIPHTHTHVYTHIHTHTKLLCFVFTGLVCSFFLRYIGYRDVCSFHSPKPVLSLHSSVTIHGSLRLVKSQILFVQSLLLFTGPLFLSFTVDHWWNVIVLLRFYRSSIVTEYVFIPFLRTFFSGDTTLCCKIFFPKSHFSSCMECLHFLRIFLFIFSKNF